MSLSTKAAGPSAPEAPGDVPQPRQALPRWVPWAVLALALTPFVVSAIALLVDVADGYRPVGDIAGTEMRTRAVGTRPVLTGLYSRDGWNHPGPILFYLLAVPYRLLGSESIALYVGALIISAVSVAGMAVVAWRRLGPGGALITLLMTGLLLHSFTPHLVRDPWNVSVTVLPFGLLVFVVWDLACGSAWSLPVALAVATFLVQTHVGYVVLAVPLVLWGVAWLLVPRWRGRRRSGADGGPRAPVGLQGPLLASAAVLAVTWLPPVVEMLLPGRSNLRRILDYFTGDHDEELHTVGEGLRLVGAQLEAVPEWLSGDREVAAFTTEPTTLSLTPVPLFLVPLALAGLVFVLRRERAASTLWWTLVVALALAVVWVARIIGPVYNYRLGWLWVVAMATTLITVWAGWVLLRPRLGPGAVRAVGAALLAGLAVVSVVNALDAADAGSPSPSASEEIAMFTRRALEVLPDRDGVVLVRCQGDDSCTYYAGLVLQLEREGVEVRVDSVSVVAGSPREGRVLDRGDPVRAILSFEVNAPFQEYDAAADRPGAGLVAYTGVLPLPERMRLVRRVEAFDRAHERGEVDDATWFEERGRLGERLNSHAVAMYLEVPAEDE